MTEQEFKALVELIRAHVAHAHATEGRHYDRPHMAARQEELERWVQEARDVLVQPKIEGE